MKILFLYNNDIALNLVEWLREQGNEVVISSERYTAENLPSDNYDLAISYSYNYILPTEVIDFFNGNIINMHISYLPWNRGTYPNIWSFLEKNPQGVTIHFLNRGLDKGDIIAQRLVTMRSEEETLQSSYLKLNDAIKELFKEIYLVYPYWGQMRKQAVGEGSYHSDSQFAPYRQIINSWDMKVNDFLTKAKDAFIQS